MIRLVDRLNGEVLGDISADDMEVLHKALTEEDESDADYYLNPETLTLLAEAGMTQPALDILHKALNERDEVDIGWEPVATERAARVFGKIVSETGEVLGGLLVDLADSDEEVEDALSWTFSRGDGTFEIALDSDDLAAAKDSTLVLTLSALGDDWLSEYELKFAESTEVDLGEIQVPIFHGKVISDTEKTPLGGIAVQVTFLADEGAMEWFGTWVTSRPDGTFSFPYRRPDESVPVNQSMLLELLGPGGEPLTDTEIENPMDLKSSDLGEIECPDPMAEAEGETDDEDETDEDDVEDSVALDPVIPGVPQRPLE